MQVIAIHSIIDTQQFWEHAAEGTRALPDGVTLHSVAPSQDGTKAICLWDAASKGDVRDLVENMVGAYSNNEYFPVDITNAVGLPQS